MKETIKMNSNLFPLPTVNLVWTSIYGVKTKLKDMDDTYIANLRDYLVKRNWYHDKLIVIVIDKLIKKRGLKKGFLDRAQIPYKNPHGLWEIWDFKNYCPKILEKRKTNETHNNP